MGQVSSNPGCGPQASIASGAGLLRPPGWDPFFFGLAASGRSGRRGAEQRAGIEAIFRAHAALPILVLVRSEYWVATQTTESRRTMSCHFFCYARSLDFFFLCSCPHKTSVLIAYAAGSWICHWVGNGALISCMRSDGAGDHSGQVGSEPTLHIEAHAKFILCHTAILPHSRHLESKPWISAHSIRIYAGKSHKSGAQVQPKPACRRHCQSTDWKRKKSLADAG